MKPKWVRWVSIRHQDGRRPSGVGYNKSKYHLQTKEGFHVACGKEIQISVDNISDTVGVCSYCAKVAKSLNIQPPKGAGK